MSSANTRIPSVDVEQAQAMMATGAEMIDVREPQEWAAGHCGHSVHVPLAQLSTSTSWTTRTRPVIVVSRTGRRAADAVRRLRAAGVIGVGTRADQHRLDLGTSGLLAVARSQRAYHELVDALANRDVGRVYRALVWGHPANPHGLIDAPIGRDHRDPLRMAVVVDGKPARTRYRVLEQFRAPAEAASLECRLESGRTHQIRVHLSAIGHPVVGDAMYGGVRSGIDSPRPFLHAARLELEHPVTHAALAFDSPLPADLASILAELEV